MIKSYTNENIYINTNNKLCNICRTTIKNEKFFKLDCGHIFHHKCYINIKKCNIC